MPPAISGRDFHEFARTEYESLVKLIIAKSERQEKFLTIFMTIAGGPWILIGIILRNSKPEIGVLSLPSALGTVFLGSAIFGILVSTIYVQARFITIYYVRAMNAIRQYYSSLNGASGKILVLPRNPFKPRHLELWSATFWTVLAMGLMNAVNCYFGARSVMGEDRLCLTLTLAVVAGLLSPLYYCVIAWRRDSQAK